MKEQHAVIGFRSRRAARTPHMQTLLGSDTRWLPLGLGGGVTAIAGWGLRQKARGARALAARRGLPFITVEDGFLRSVERNDPPLSVIVDDLGIYLDAARPSRFEQYVSSQLDEAQGERVRALMAAWRQARVSKYNHARDYAAPLPARFVLVCDQTFGDASISYGQADGTSFTRMLEAALAESPDCHVVVKMHPDVFTRRRRGYFDPQKLKSMPRVVVIAADVHPVSLIEKAEAVYTVTSQMGFEALLWGKPVRTFGMPFYAGWGLTQDDLSAPERRASASLEQLVHAALIAYPRYVDPETGERCEVERVLAHIALQRKMRTRYPAHVHAIGFSAWKRPILRRFLAGSEISFVASGREVPHRDTVVVWGSNDPPGLPDDSKRIRIEDGFLRSVGLGAELTHPLSWVCDDEGIYYDPARPSGLERILAETRFDEALLARARKLRRTILDSRLTKYNLDTKSSDASWRRPERDTRIILVPGQVEDDASIRFGAPGLRANLDMLRAVREANKNAYVIYKPHPDVVAGLRAKGADESNAVRYCDEIVTSGDMAQLLEGVDEVHTLTSLGGFEALMRGKQVVCYGQPFYAGWGLTQDMVPIERRERLLSLDELVAGALILYPAYVSRITQRFTTPEQAVKELISWRQAGGGRRPLQKRMLRSLLGVWKAIGFDRRSRTGMKISQHVEAINGRE